MKDSKAIYDYNHSDNYDFVLEVIIGQNEISRIFAEIISKISDWSVDELNYAHIGTLKHIIETLTEINNSMR